MDPATPSMAFALNYASIGRVMALYQNVNQTLMNSLCGPSCLKLAPYYFGVTNSTAPPTAFTPDPIMTTLSAPNCVEGQALLASFLGAAVKNNVAVGDFVYLALTLVPPNSTTYSNVTELLEIVDHDARGFGRLVATSLGIMQQFQISLNDVSATKVSNCCFYLYKLQLFTNVKWFRWQLLHLGVKKTLHISHHSPTRISTHCLPMHRG